MRSNTKQLGNCHKELQQHQEPNHYQHQQQLLSTTPLKHEDRSSPFQQRPIAIIAGGDGRVDRNADAPTRAMQTQYHHVSFAAILPPLWGQEQACAWAGEADDRTEQPRFACLENPIDRHRELSARRQGFLPEGWTATNFFFLGCKAWCNRWHRHTEMLINFPPVLTLEYFPSIWLSKRTQQIDYR